MVYRALEEAPESECLENVFIIKGGDVEWLLKIYREQY